jgi:hypothetical protein
MKKPTLPQPLRRLLLSEPFWRLLPTPATLYLNHARVREPMKVPELTASDWSRRERRALLTGSEERMRNLEAKGPGLATINAVIVAAVLVCITGGWDESRTLARIILVLASVYAVLSLLMPLYLVGPLRRDAVHIAELEAAARARDTEEALAASAAEAAMNNDLRNLRLSNMLDAARRELSYTLALLLLWVVLVPGFGVLKRSHPQHPQQGQAEHLARPARKKSNATERRASSLRSTPIRKG